MRIVFFCQYVVCIVLSVITLCRGGTESSSGATATGNTNETPSDPRQERLTWHSTRLDHDDPSKPPATILPASQNNNNNNDNNSNSDPLAIVITWKNRLLQSWNDLFSSSSHNPASYFFNPQQQSSHDDLSSKDASRLPAPLKVPVVYRYYSRNPKLTTALGTIPFVLLGPNVDHWKLTAKELASRGYNVMACERLQGDDNDSQSQSTRTQTLPTTRQQGWTFRDSANLILQLLNALKWNMAVLVACDEESIVAVEAALQLAPNRIAGLIVCGRLPDSCRDMERAFSNTLVQVRNDTTQYQSMDELLQNHVQCPFSVVWDGSVPSSPPQKETGDLEETLSSTGARSGFSAWPPRTLILGGGAAPHRRRPEHFAWCLTRFVETNIITRTLKRKTDKDDNDNDDNDASLQKDVPQFESSSKRRREPQNEAEFDKQVFHQELFVVSGRVVASAILYGALLRTLMFQYGTVKFATINVSSALQSILSIPVKTVSSLLSIPRLILGFGSTLLSACYYSAPSDLTSASPQNDATKPRPTWKENSTAEDFDLKSNANSTEEELETKLESNSSNNDPIWDDQIIEKERNATDSHQLDNNATDVDEQPKERPEPYFLLDYIIV